MEGAVSNSYERRSYSRSPVRSRSPVARAGGRSRSRSPRRYSRSPRRRSRCGIFMLIWISF